jgi:hypothetical protein
VRLAAVFCNEEKEQRESEGLRLEQRKMAYRLVGFGGRAGRVLVGGGVIDCKGARRRQQRSVVTGKDQLMDLGRLKGDKGEANRQLESGD